MCPGLGPGDVRPLRWICFDAAMQAEYEKPYNDLEKNLGAMADAAEGVRIEQMQEQLDPEHVRKELSSHEGRVRLSLELGATNRRKAEYDAERIRTGAIPIEKAIHQVIAKRAAGARDLQKQIETRSNAATAKRQRVRDEIGKSDLETLNYADVATRAGVDSEVVEDDPDLNEAMRVQRGRKTLDMARTRFEKADSRIEKIDAKTVAGYQGDVDAWMADQSVEFMPSQQRRAQKAFAGVGEAVERQREDQRQQNEKFQKTLDRIEAGTVEKPVSLSPGDTHVISVDALLGYLGDDRVRQTSLDIAITRKSDQIDRDLKTRERSRSQKRTQLSAMTAAQRKVKPDAALALQFEIDNLTAEIDELRQSAEKIQEYRAGASATTTVVSQDEWDALIGRGHTPDALKKRGIVVK